MAKSNIVKTGIVDDICRDKYTVIANGNKITCAISGKIRLNQIQIVVGDRVDVEVSPADSSRGRIIKRLKN